MLYSDILERAIKDPSHDNLEALANWLDSCGAMFWNGECWDASRINEPSGTRSLFPVLDDDYNVVGYELR